MTVVTVEVLTEAEARLDRRLKRERDAQTWRSCAGSLRSIAPMLPTFYVGVR